jgi:hypothetical protein
MGGGSFPGKSYLLVWLGFPPGVGQGVEAARGQAFSTGEAIGRQGPFFHSSFHGEPQTRLDACVALSALLTVDLNPEETHLL